MKIITTDGNGAVSHVSYAFSEIAVIYPITPSSPMAEQADEWSATGKENLFGKIPQVVQMQSEGGAAGALHGALTCGALATTYTCSQGLLLMLPVMYKIAGELLPTVFHVSARALSAHALSIFGDHQDVMACRQTGFAMLASSNVQEAADMALVAHLSTLNSSVPFLHFFDGFRTSHEVNKIEVLDYAEMKRLLDEDRLTAFRRRGLTPEKPIQRGTAQNPDTYFQNRERANEYYLALPQIVQSAMDQLAAITGRQYHLFSYFGAPQAEHVAVLIGSGCATMQETVTQMNDSGFSVGLIYVRLYRPFDVNAFCAALPTTVKTVSVLDRTKEAGALGEPLYLDVCTALKEKGRGQVCVYGGRYGLGGKDFTPEDCYAVFQNALSQTPKNHFTVGIKDDITQSSLHLSKAFPIDNDYVECIFYGLGSDGTVGANKNSLKVIGNHTPLFVQGFFCYDSRKSGGVTISHLRFGKTPIHSPYLIQHADFVACHNPSYLQRYDMLSTCKDGGVFLLNCPWLTMDELEKNLPATVKQAITKKRLDLYVIDGTSIAKEVGLKGKTSTVMQAAFFYLNQSILPYAQAKELLFEEITRKFSKKGDTMVAMNRLAIEKAEGGIRKIEYPSSWENTSEGAEALAHSKDRYFQDFILPILQLKGDELPVSAFQADGSVPTNTSKLEKHGAPLQLPKWLPQNCIQCNQCSFVCPHACIRPFLLPTDTETPQSFATINAVGVVGKFRIQVSPHDCMGCGVCAHTCPAKEKALVMTPSQSMLHTEGGNWEYAQSAPTIDAPFKRNSVKGSQFSTPLFEFSYACAGCGETAYIKLLTQLFGERLLIANATGCSSIYGGSSPTCPYALGKNGHGPAWASSLFEDNAEFGLGMRLAQDLDSQTANRSVWCIGGDGWAYDIGYGGLDHVLASGKNVNILVLDSEVYSNTGGQKSKATPMGATARFASSGKKNAKKNLGLMAMSYKNVYVAQVCMGANMQQLINAFTEAESYNGPSLILAYAPCIEHGYDMGKSIEEEKRAVASGYWQLYRFNPNMPQPFTLDSKQPTLSFQEFLAGENRFQALKKSNPELAEQLFQQAEKDNNERFAFYQKLSTLFA